MPPQPPLRIAGHALASLESPDRHWYEKPAVTYAQMVIDHDKRLDALDTWRAELRGAMQLIKFALGASVVSGIASTIAIVRMLSGS